MTRQLIAVNGVRLNAEVRDPAPDAPETPEPPATSRRTVVLLHGFTGSAAGWGEHLDTFAAAGLRVIALDMLGHGLSLIHI